jgi:hypothetical protein
MIFISTYDRTPGRELINPPDFERIKRIAPLRAVSAGTFITSQLTGSSMQGADANLTGVDLNALVATAIEMATQNAISFVDLGMTPDDFVASPGGNSSMLSLPAAVDMLDRVKVVLNAARDESSTAVNDVGDAVGGDIFTGPPAAAPDGFLTAVEMLKLMGLTGLPTATETNDGNADAEGPTRGFPYNVDDDPASLEKVFDLFEDDPLGGASGGNHVLDLI